MRAVEGVLQDVGFLGQARGDIDRRIGDQQRFVVAGHIQHEDVRQTSFGAQAQLPVGNRSEQLAGGQAAFHQCVNFPSAYQAHRFGGCGMAVFAIDQAQPADIQVGGFGCRANA